jgi:hypothetical protein
MWLCLITCKNEAATVIKQFQARAEAKSGKKLRVLWMDRDCEFMSIEFIEYMR